MERSSLKNNSDPLGAMVLDYLAGNRAAALKVYSDTVETWTLSGEILFRDYSRMDSLERTALAHCRGTVLDIGAGSGCHTLYLQESGLEVHALDNSAGCIEAMRQRGVSNLIEENFFDYEGSRRYDTLLLLMNGLGISGTIFGLSVLLEHAVSHLAPGGQIIAESTDLSSIFDGDFDFSMDYYSGEIDFVMEYEDIRSAPFLWLYVGFATLQTLASLNGFHCEKMMDYDGNRYLVRIYR